MHFKLKNDSFFSLIANKKNLKVQINFHKCSKTLRQLADWGAELQKKHYLCTVFGSQLRCQAKSD